MLKTNSVPNGLDIHIFNSVNHAKKVDAALKAQKEIESTINQIGKDNILNKMRNVNFDTVFSAIRQNDIFNKLNKVLEGKGQMLVKIAFTSIFTLVANPFVSIVFADNSASKAMKDLDDKMWEICRIIFTIGGWTFVCFAIKEIIESMIKKDNDSILGIIIKYVLAFIAMLLMPRILHYAKDFILG